MPLSERLIQEIQNALTEIDEAESKGYRQFVYRHIESIIGITNMVLSDKNIAITMLQEEPEKGIYTAVLINKKPLGYIYKDDIVYIAKVEEDPKEITGARYATVDDAKTEFPKRVILEFSDGSEALYREEKGDRRRANGRDI